MEDPILKETFQPGIVLEFHHHLGTNGNIEEWSAYGVETHLSVHLVVLVVAVNECHSVAILLNSTLALPVTVLPSSLEIVNHCIGSSYLR